MFLYWIIKYAIKKKDAPDYRGAIFINENQEFAKQTNSQNIVPTTVKQSEKNDVEKLIPTKNNSETDHQKLAIENSKDSLTPLRNLKDSAEPMTNSIKKETH